MTHAINLSFLLLRCFVPFRSVLFYLLLMLLCCCFVVVLVVFVPVDPVVLVAVVTVCFVFGLVFRRRCSSDTR